MTGPVMETCVNPKQFELIDGVITPQPWMQLRRVATAEHEGKSVQYDTSGGGNKNDNLHNVQTHWTNNTPVTQYVYGLVTAGGQQVALQARSRGYFEYRHGWLIAPSAEADDFAMEPCDRFGGGADIGQGGQLAVGTGFCVHDVRAPMRTSHFMPHITGWFPVEPGETFQARVELWFKSENWESGMIDKGDQGTESTIKTGGTRLDLFAVPGVDPPVKRSVPTVVGITWDIDNPDGQAHCDKPLGTASGDYMVAILAATGGNHSAMTAPAGWTMKAEYDGGAFKLHCKIFEKVAGGSEPASYQFGVPAGLGTEGMIQIVTLRGVDVDESMDVELKYTAPPFLFGKKETHLPSIVTYKKLMLGFSFFSHTPLQGQVEQEEPAGMTLLTSDEGDLISLATAYQANPPNPTGDRTFKASEPLHLGDGRISGVISVTGPVIP